jgi:hypothetical protein
VINYLNEVEKFLGVEVADATKRLVILAGRFYGKTYYSKLIDKEINRRKLIMAEKEVKGNEATGKKKLPEIPKKNPAPEGATKESKPPKEKKEKVIRVGAKYTLLKEYDPAGSEKMPLQCKQILTIIGAAPDKTITKADLLEEMKKIVVTRQPIDRILAFYQPRIISGKYIKMETLTGPGPVKTEPATTPDATA